MAMLLLVAAVGCSNPKDTKLPQDLSKIDTIKPSVEKLTPEEKELLGGYIMMRMMGTGPGATSDPKTKAIPEGMTIGKAIEEQRAYVKDMSPAQVAARLKKKKDEPAK
jgi:hypothetical protein